MQVDGDESKSGPSISDRRRIPELDGWRGISIALVVVGHVINRRYSPSIDQSLIPIADVMALWGVDVFFVISGYIITKLALTEQEGRGSFSPSAFYIRRFFRIVPAFYSYLAFILVFSAAGLIVQSSDDTVIAATFTCNLGLFSCGWFAGHTWTLAYEEQFYLIFPALFALARRRTRLAFLVIFAALVATPFLVRALGLTGIAHDFALFVSSFIFISAGSVLAAYEPMMERLAGSRLGRRLTIASGAFLLGLICLFSIPPVPGSWMAYLQRAITLTLLPLIISWLIGSSLHRTGVLRSILRWRALRGLGLISYSLYLWQQAFSLHPSLYSRDSILLLPPLMLLVATLSYFAIERPFVRAGKRFLASTTTRQPINVLSPKTSADRQKP